MKLPPGVSLHDAMTLASGFHKLNAVDFSFDTHRRYTFWSGTFGALFLMLSYFGTDQSQVQRYITGSSLRESRLGLMFNAICKIPMQFFILLLGALLFVFYQFEQPPVLFSSTTSQASAFQEQFSIAHAQKEQFIHQWLAAERSGDINGVAQFRAQALAANDHLQDIRAKAKATIPHLKGNENDYVFITFILKYLPHGLIGLLVAAFFAAALSSKAAELNALASTTTVDFYRHIIRREASDAHYLIASKSFLVLWGCIAIAFALFANLSENLIQAVNIIGSIFYGVVLGIFLVAFFLRFVKGTAVFYGAIASQLLVFVLYFSLSISYLWYNFIGCAICVALSVLIQTVL
jgi:solute:Na+ symporter, SSS family